MKNFILFQRRKKYKHIPTILSFITPPPTFLLKMFVSPPSLQKEQLLVFTIGSDEKKLENLKFTSGFQTTDIQYVKKTPWTGYIDKITTMIEILEKRCRPKDIVCFVDAYDVLCFADEEEIHRKFKEYDCKILLSSELNPYPPKFQSQYDFLEYQIQEWEWEEWERKEQSREEEKISHLSSPFEGGGGVFSTLFKYVNSGGYIGYADALLKMLKWKSVKEITAICEDGGDQTYFSLYYLEHALQDKRKWIRLDEKQEIFQSMYRIDFTDFYFKGGRLCNNVLHTQPCFAHFNGFGIYGNKIVSLETEKQENVYEVFIDKMIKSMAQPNILIPLNYRVLFFLFYNGSYQFNLPQLPCV